MASKQTRSTRKVKPKHRAIKPRAERPLDVAKADNHAARHAAKVAAMTELAVEAAARAKVAAESLDPPQEPDHLAAGLDNPPQEPDPA